MGKIYEEFKVDQSEYIELYRDSDFILTIPLTHKASKKYGSGTKWCTTNRECDKDFNNHIKLGILGYIVIRDNELKNKFGSNAFAIYRLFNGDPNRFIAFDDQNNEYRNGESWLMNKFDRQDKLFQYYKMLKQFNNYFEDMSKQPIKESTSKYSTIKNQFRKKWLTQINNGEIPRIPYQHLTSGGFPEELIDEVTENYLEFVGGEDVALRYLDKYLEGLIVTHHQTQLVTIVDPNDRYSIKITGIIEMNDEEIDYGFAPITALLSGNGAPIDIDDIEDDELFFDLTGTMIEELDVYLEKMVFPQFGLSLYASGHWDD